MPVQDNDMIAGIFPGEAIIVEHGKLPWNLCYHAADERIRFQEQKLWGIFYGGNGPKNHFFTAVARVAA